MAVRPATIARSFARNIARSFARIIARCWLQSPLLVTNCPCDDQSPSYESAATDPQSGYRFCDAGRDISIWMRLGHLQQALPGGPVVDFVKLTGLTIMLPESRFAR